MMDLAQQERMREAYLIALYKSHAGNYGGDRPTLRTTIYSGRHGRCPAWILVLTPAQIRALAVYLYVESGKTAPQGLRESRDS